MSQLFDAYWQPNAIGRTSIRNPTVGGEDVLCCCHKQLQWLTSQCVMMRYCYIYMHIHTYNKYYVYKTAYDFKRKQHRTPNHAAAAERLFFFPGFMVMVRKTWTLLHLWAETVPPMPLFVEPIVAFSVRPAWDAAHGWPLGLGLIPAVCGLRARFLICFI